MITAKEILKIRESSQLLDVIAEIADKIIELEKQLLLLSAEKPKKEKSFFDFEENED
jgi:hypothetical protein